MDIWYIAFSLIKSPIHLPEMRKNYIRTNDIEFVHHCFFQLVLYKTTIYGVLNEQTTRLLTHESIDDGLGVRHGFADCH